MDSALRLKKVLVPTDFSRHSEHAFRHGAVLAKMAGAELVVMHVVEKFMDHSLLYSDVWPFQKPVNQYYNDLEERTARRLARQVEEAAGDAVEFRVLVTTGNPAEEIIRAVQEEEVDLIVISTHGRGALAQALIGSTTDRVLRRAPCPVLVIRADSRGFVTGGDPAE
jgi:nucleotide-binding universal stress UspA family protein